MGSGRILSAAAVLAALALPAGLGAQEPVQEPAQEPAPTATTPSAEPAEPARAAEPATFSAGEAGPAVAARQTTARPGTANVKVADYSFTPREIEVEEGDTVVWINDGPDEVHTATADDGTFDTGEIAVGASAAFTFEDPGRYPYLCEIHPSQRGTVKVLAANDPAARGGDGGDDGSGGTPTDETPDPTGGSFPGINAPPIESTDSASGGSADPLPDTGFNGLPLFLAGAAFIAAGLLAGALARFAEWRG